MSITGCRLSACSYTVLVNCSAAAAKKWGEAAEQKTHTRYEQAPSLQPGKETLKRDKRTATGLGRSA
ncbi:MAG: hypothetical protein ACHP83_03650, partial [Burkholderiales bacterium]